MELDTYKDAGVVFSSTNGNTINGQSSYTVRHTKNYINGHDPYFSGRVDPIIFNIVDTSSPVVLTLDAGDNVFDRNDGGVFIGFCGHCESYGGDCVSDYKDVTIRLNGESFTHGGYHLHAFKSTGSDSRLD